MQHLKISKCDLLVDKVNVDLDMLGLTMMYRVSCHIYNSHIIAEDNGGGGEQEIKLLKKLAQPTFGDTISNRTVLWFSSGMRDSGLALGRQRHQIVAEEDAVARCGTPGVGTPCPGRIEYTEELGRTKANMKSCREGGLFLT